MAPAQMVVANSKAAAVARRRRRRRSQPAARLGQGSRRGLQRQVVGDGLEVGGELGGRLIAVAGVGLEAAQDHGFEGGGDFGVSVAQARQRAQPLVGGPQQASTTDEPRRGDAEGPLAGHGLEEHDAQPVDVGAAVDLVGRSSARAFKMLGRPCSRSSRPAWRCRRPSRRRARARVPG